MNCFAQVSARSLESSVFLEASADVAEYCKLNDYQYHHQVYLRYMIP